MNVELNIWHGVQTRTTHNDVIQSRFVGAKKI